MYWQNWRWKTDDANGDNDRYFQGGWGYRPFCSGNRDPRNAAGTREMFVHVAIS
ncbi:hypothetical protein A1F94_011517 [Pyrenophora tritici-repentis]|nr:hypothetical protein A1F99_130100 [Pyrenophora tritici-repentis]KAG9378401.1 hypothetical protein A1F94_011517 [Pyrenophora tritici-repentis]KAI0617443.1 hypothetical protein TUN199_10566 [Pyrenophora tritici-repentis]KAI1665176.1 hypothetical protein L13192_11295 [Pyrenophora tritici-repentis]